MRINQELMKKLSSLQQIETARLKELYEYFDHEAELIDDLIKLYADLLPESLNDIKGSVATKNAEGLKSAAHKLKSSSNNMGLKKIGAICEWLETQGASQNLSEVNDEVSALLNEATNIENKLKSVFKEISEKK